MHGQRRPGSMLAAARVLVDPANRPTGRGNGYGTTRASALAGSYG
jgi:hypothetical protein